MKNFFLLALPVLATALTTSDTVTNPLSADKIKARADCVLHAHYRDDWIENGLKRFRVKFSTEPDGLQQGFCDAFQAATCYRIGGWENLQCGFDSGVDGGSWRVDVSVPNTDVGYDQYKTCMQEAANEWRRVHNTCDVDSSW